MPEKTAPVYDENIRKRRDRPKKARRITPDYLHNAALFYLERYAASTGRLRQILRDKITRSCRDHPDQKIDELLPLIEPEIATLTRVQLLDDHRLADMLLSGYRNRGLSQRLIQQKLQLKGFDRTVIEQMLNQIDPKHQSENEIAAAIRYLQRRKLWPYLKEQPTDRAILAKAKQKAWAALARQGYGPDIITNACNLILDD